MEAEGQSMGEQLCRSANQEKGLAQIFALVLFSAVTCLSVVHSIRDGAQPILGIHQLASGHKGESRGQG